MALYAIPIFLSAALLFLVQPLIGKYILPWFGGGSGVWTVCLMFFQTMLLAGYAYAHGIVRYLSPRWQVGLHVALLALSLMFLPIIPSGEWKPSDSGDPTWRIVGLLAVSIGPSFLLLSATGPLLQAWLARSLPGRSPYRLYALSNAGSLLALLAYPLILEPLTTRRIQALGWSAGFVAFALVCAWTAIRSLRSAAAPPTVFEENASEGVDSSRAPALIDRALWVLLPACSTALLLAVTSALTEDVAPVPLLWVTPLAVYLLTFIVCFDRPWVYRRGLFAVLLLATLWLAALLSNPALFRIGGLVASHLAVLTVCCMVCHGELYRLRPPPRRLTAYYLALAAGGALGGAFVSLAAPVIFTSRAEYPLALFGCAALLLVRMFNDPASRFYRGRARPMWLTFIMLALGAAVLLKYQNAEDHRSTQHSFRNFYGVLRVTIEHTDQPELMYARLEHGHITHGVQIANPALRRWPTAYYSNESGAGLLLRLETERPRRIGAVGLGVGTLATYGRSGDVFRFYEIDDDVITIASEWFTYLSDSQARIEMVPGDARLSMERESPQNYDVLLLDAFTGDAIPAHLLTLEAFRLYQRHLHPGGVLAVHISNRHLHLERVVAAAARQLGYEMRIIINPEDLAKQVYKAKWALLTRNTAVFEMSAIKSAIDASPQSPSTPLLWTDEYASVLPLLRWRRE